MVIAGMWSAKYFAVAALVGAAGVDAFAPASLAGLPATRPAAACRPQRGLALRMAETKEEGVEYKPVIPTPEAPLPPNYKDEPTLFEAQGLVESSKSTNMQPGESGGMGQGEFGGLTRREAIGGGSAVGIGSLAVLWAVTRNPGYDKGDTSRDAGKVEVNKEAIATPEVKKALTEVAAIQATVEDLEKKFRADNNVQLSGDIKAKFDIVKIRDDLNKLTFAAFDEDTQIKTDRIVRNIIQDLIELEQAVKLKEGVARSPKRVSNTDKWFKQASSDLAKFLAYFK